MARHASEPVLVPWRLGFSQQQLQLLQTPGVFLRWLGWLGWWWHIYIYIIYMILFIYRCATRFLETKMHPISPFTCGISGSSQTNPCGFLSFFSGRWTQLFGFDGPLTFDDGKGRRSLTAFLPKGQVFLATLWQIAVWNFIEIMRVWYICICICIKYVYLCRDSAPYQ